MYQPGLEHHFEDLEKQRHAAQLGMWIFLASELLLFAALFTLYYAYRAHFPQVFHEGVGHNPRHLGTLNTCILLLGSLTAALAVNALRRNRTGAARLLAAGTVVAAIGFLIVKIYEYGLHFQEGIFPGGAGDFFAAHPEPGWPIFFTLYFAMTGLHAIHVTLGGLLFAFITWWIGRARVGAAGAYRAELGALYWHFVDVIWVFLWPMFYLLGAHE
jgi:cytochrome c oxidase subunit 3